MIYIMAIMFWTIVYAVMVALWVAFLLLLAYKVGIVEWMQVHGGKFISKMAQCDFCMSWWLSVIITLVFLGLTGDVELLVVPFLSTPIARRLL